MRRARPRRAQRPRPGAGRHGRRRPRACPGWAWGRAWWPGPGRCFFVLESDDISSCSGHACSVGDSRASIFCSVGVTRWSDAKRQNTTKGTELTRCRRRDHHDRPPRPAPPLHLPPLAPLPPPQPAPPAHPMVTRFLMSVFLVREN